MPADPPRISVVVPIYNEAPNIGPLLEQLQAALEGMGERYEVVAVDDGSGDGSGRLLAEAMDGRPWLRVVRLPENRGQTAAFLAGFDKARGEVILTIDADLQNDPADIPKLVSLIGEHDVVCGVRTKRDDPVQKRWGSKLANGFRRWVLKDGIKDTGCSLKAFRRECARAVPPYNGMHRFLPFLMGAAGYRVAQVDVNHRPREAGVSKYGTFDRLAKSLPDLFAVRWMSKRRLALDSEEVRGGETGGSNEASGVSRNKAQEEPVEEGKGE